jgi:hypothetical protein
MPSPFPGMDPFLESPDYFPGLHDRLVAVLGEVLQAILPEPYFAEIGEVLWVETTKRFIEPDVDDLRRDDRAHVPTAGSEGVAVSTPSRSTPILVRVPHDERKRTFLEIRARRGEGEELVTSIEILSPSNKTPGQQARELYLRKQQEILEGDTALVEIDLFRGGRHTTAVVPDLAFANAGPIDYHVCVHPYADLEDFLVYPIQLPDRLPEIDIPLLPEDEPARVDLQSVFDRAYDVGPNRRRVRYAERQPAPPLRSDQIEWVTQVLREKGLVAAQ